MARCFVIDGQVSGLFQGFTYGVGFWRAWFSVGHRGIEHGMLERYIPNAYSIATCTSFQDSLGGGLELLASHLRNAYLHTTMGVRVGQQQKQTCPSSPEINV